MRHEIRPLTESQLPAVAEAIARAFMKDPFQNHTFPVEEDRAARSPAHFTAALRYGSMFGEVYSCDSNAGASIWLKPGETVVTPERAEAGGFAALPEIMGAEAFGRFSPVIGFTEEMHYRDMPEPHWYTMVLGVDPVYQGQGFGRALMQPVLDRARADGLPVYLETAQPDNVSFYRHLGFRVLRDVIEPSSGLRLWTFRRDG